MWLLGIFIAVVLVALIAAKIAPRLGLLAYPGGHRQHSQPTPLVGGIAIMAGLLVFFFFVQEQQPALLLPISLIFVLGLLDDRFKLPSYLRFAVQALALWLAIQVTGVQLNSLGQLLPGADVQLHSWSVPMTIFAGLGVINAINMSDGLDGLAGTLVLTALVGLLILIQWQDDLALATVIAVAGFLALNLRLGRARAHLFLGDAGSTLLGFILAFLLIKYSQEPQALMAPVTALWILTLPLFDAVAVLLVRPLRGKSPFSADLIHYHHLLKARGLGVNQTLIILLLMQTTLIMFGLLMLHAGVAEYIQLLIFLLLFSCYLLFLWRATGEDAAPPSNAEY